MRLEFTRATMRLAFIRAKGLCEHCRAPLTQFKFRFDHIIPCELGGGNSLDNCQVICSTCDKRKTARDAGNIAKAKRLADTARGIRPRRNRVRGWRRFDGTPVRNPRL